MHCVLDVIVATTILPFSVKESQGDPLEDCNHTCANNWIEFEDKCYKWSKNKTTWEDAERSCR